MPKVINNLTVGIDDDTLKMLLGKISDLQHQVHSLATHVTQLECLNTLHEVYIGKLRIGIDGKADMSAVQAYINNETRAGGSLQR